MVFASCLAPPVSLPALDLSSAYDCHLDATVLQRVRRIGNGAV